MCVCMFIISMTPGWGVFFRTFHCRLVMAATRTRTAGIKHWKKYDLACHAVCFGPSPLKVKTLINSQRGWYI